MRYVILANPQSGNLPEYEKEFLLSGARGILDCDVIGFGQLKNKFLSEAVRLKQEYDCVVVAGGDGTFSDVINSSSNQNVVLAYLPLGTGNAMGSALGYGMSKFGDLASIAGRIKNGENKSIDVILCETPTTTTKGLMVGVGMDADIINRSQGLRKAGMNSLNSYIAGSITSVFGGYQRETISLEIDDKATAISDLVAFAISKHPYFGYGLRANPHAVLNSGKLHGLSFTGGIPMILKLLLTSSFDGTIFGGNTQGIPYTADRIKITSTNPLPLHIDGNFVDAANEFEFTILPKELTMRY
ncbi:hypothetical protein HQ489_04375 [Candidatus Woesearchaeota archaeon]|nr:hypothetical protein [Candidatus Woesearchaeota archaeon]